MTEPSSLKQIESLLSAMPGVTIAKLNRSDSGTVIAVFRCDSLSGFDALARCGSGSNVPVILGQSDSLQMRKLDPVSSLECHAEFDDETSERPSACERFGFYAASLLYNDSLVDDNLLDELESAWNVDFNRNAG